MAAHLVVYLVAQWAVALAASWVGERVDQSGCSALTLAALSVVELAVSSAVSWADELAVLSVALWAAPWERLALMLVACWAALWAGATVDRWVASTAALRAVRWGL